MEHKQSLIPSWILLAGDALVLLVVTLSGFASHNSSLDNGRWLTTFAPLVVAWALIAPWLGNYQVEQIKRPAQVWRSLLAMILAAPLAGFLRALLLNVTVVPIFVVALGGVSALAMTAWRLVWAWLAGHEFSWMKPR